MRNKFEPIWLRKDTTIDDVIDQLIEQFCDKGATEVQAMAVSYSKKEMFEDALRMVIKNFLHRKIYIEESEKWQQNGPVRKKIHVFHARLD